MVEAPNPTRSIVIDLTFKGGKEFFPEYTKASSTPPPHTNNINLGMIALSRLGASESQLRSFYQSYAGLLEKKAGVASSSSSEISDNMWYFYRGKGTNFTALKQYFIKKIAKEGWAKVLADSLPWLIDGMSGSAFHGICEVGAAIDFGMADDCATLFAHALACWTYEWKLLGSLAIVPARPLDPLGTLRELATTKLKFEQTLKISEQFRSRMHILADPEYSNELQQFDLMIEPKGEKDLHELNSLMLHSSIQLFAYSGCDNYFLLRAVIAARAVQLINTCITGVDLKGTAIREFWRALVCTYIAAHRPAIRSASEFDQFYSQSAVQWKNWAELVPAAIASNDEAILCLVQCCQSIQSTEATDLPFRAAALTLHRRTVAKTNWTV